MEVEAAKNVTHKILDLDEFPLRQLGCHGTARLSKDS